MSRDLFTAAYRAPPGARLRQERVGTPTIEELERLQEVLALCLLKYGQAALPSFERFEAELAARRSENSAIDRVRSIARRASAEPVS